MSPDDLLKAVDELCKDIIQRKELTEKLEKFLTEGEWSGKAFAHKLRCVLSGDIPQDWFVDPQTVDYKMGVGLLEHHAKDIAYRMIEMGGIQSLQLADKPILVANYQEWLKDRNRLLKFTL